MDWLAVWLNVGSPIVQGVLHLLFISRFLGKRTRFWYFPLYLASLFAINTAVSGGPAVVLEMLVLYAITRLQNGRAVSCVAAVFAVYASLLSYGMVNSAGSLLVPYISSEILLFVFIVSAELAALGVCISCYALLLRFFSLKGTEASAWMLLPLGLFLPLNEFYILNYAYGNVVSTPFPLEPSRHLTLLLLQGMSLLALFSALYAYQRICQDFRTQAVLTALRQETRAQKIYVAEAQARYAQTQSFRHDVQNHLTVLAGLLNTGRIKEAKNYTDRLARAAGDLSPAVQTGNPVVDILVTDKLALADSMGIQAAIDLALPNACVVDGLDWCVIFANALDNAIHAASCVEKDSSIHISGTRQGDFYLLAFENTRLDEPLPPPGIGLKNIQAAAETYHGTMTAEADGTIFRLHVLLDISRPPDGISAQSS